MRNCLILTASLGLSFLQCSKADEPAPKYPDGTSFCNGMAAAECSDTVISNCAASSKDVCISKLVPGCLSTYVTPAQQAGLTYSSGQAENCVNQVSSAYSDAIITAAEEQSIALACDAVYGGSGAKGSSCVQDKDCKQSDGLRCVIHAAASTPDAGESEGTCQVPMSTSAGQSCSKIDAECAEGFHCSGSPLYCVANGQANDPCNNGAPCSQGLQCPAGVCIAQFPDNTACTSDDQCINGVCITTTSGHICASKEILAPSEPFCAALH